MAHYDLLREFLKKTPARCNDITLSFDQIGQLLGKRLPESARKLRPWWGNEKNPASHSQSAAWQAARFKVGRVALDKSWVRFERI